MRNWYIPERSASIAVLLTMLFILILGGSAVAKVVEQEEENDPLAGKSLVVLGTGYKDSVQRIESSITHKLIEDDSFSVTPRELVAAKTERKELNDRRKIPLADAVTIAKEAKVDLLIYIDNVDVDLEKSGKLWSKKEGVSVTFDYKIIELEGVEAIHSDTVSSRELEEVNEPLEGNPNLSDQVEVAIKAATQEFIDSLNDFRDADQVDESDNKEEDSDE